MLLKEDKHPQWEMSVTFETWVTFHFLHLASSVAFFSDCSPPAHPVANRGLMSSPHHIPHSTRDTDREWVMDYDWTSVDGQITATYFTNWNIFWVIRELHLLEEGEYWLPVWEKRKPQDDVLVWLLNFYFEKENASLHAHPVLTGMCGSGLRTTHNDSFISVSLLTTPVTMNGQYVQSVSACETAFHGFIFMGCYK